MDGASPVITGICFSRSIKPSPAGPGGDLVCQIAGHGQNKPSGGTSSIGKPPIFLL